MKNTLCKYLFFFSTTSPSLLVVTCCALGGCIAGTYADRPYLVFVVDFSPFDSACTSNYSFTTCTGLRCVSIPSTFMKFHICVGICTAPTSRRYVFTKIYISTSRDYSYFVAVRLICALFTHVVSSLHDFSMSYA